MKRLTQVGTSIFSSLAYLAAASSVFAQTATLSASKGGAGGTDSALLDAGTRELTFVLFFAGLALFVFGSLKIVASFRD